MNIFVTKETRLNIRIKPDFKDELAAAAEYHGLTVSSYVHSVLVKTIRELKNRDAAALEFIEVAAAVNIEKTEHAQQTKAEIERDYRLKQAQIISIDAGINPKELPYEDVEDQREPLEDEHAHKPKKRRAG